MSEKGPVYHVYCDESRQTADRFMVFGGIIVPATNVEAFNQAMKLWRDSNRMHAELKWGKVSNAKLAEYKSLVDLFFSLAGQDSLHFKAVVFDTSQIDYKTYHHGDKDLGFYKFFYTFLLHKFGPYAADDTYRLLVFLDQRVTSYKLSTLCTVLNNGIRKKFNRNVDVVRKVEPVDSKKCELVQVADVLMGAVGYHCNDCHTRPGAKRAKIELAHYIAQKAKLLSLNQSTPFGQRRFEIWRFRFSGK